jgi:hypothetical protein
VNGLDFEGFEATAFEEFCFQLLDGLDGFCNVDWRKGTPKQASPADRGRDIVAKVERRDVDGSKYDENWFVDCKPTPRVFRRRRFRAYWPGRKRSGRTSRS